jgi:aspartate/methionine/tyrosine aminotransferase
MAIIADEVFADYPIDSENGPPPPLFSRVLQRGDVLTFSLGGLSKSVGLPQVKLGWIAVGGPDPCRADALARLELACDTYLSVSTPVQIAAEQLLQRGTAVRKQIQVRVRRNHAVLVARGRRAPACRVLAAEGGWYAVVQVPSIGSEEELALSLLEQRGVLAHPGYFFDFQRGSHLIVSLLPMEASFDAGIERLFQHVESGGPS